MGDRDELRRIATHVLARGQQSVTGRIGLRPSPGGFATVEFGERRERLRVSGGLLVHEAGGPPAVSRAVAIDGANLGQLAEFAGVDLDAELSVGHDTPPLGEVEAVIELDVAEARRLGDWFAVVAQALDRVAAAHEPTMAQLWPEHFDLAVDLAYDAAAPSEHRVNLGGSPGDESHDAPYLYVGPWTRDRPGDPAWWNAPFGAVLSGADVMATPDPVEAATRFFREGLARLRPDA